MNAKQIYQIVKKETNRLDAIYEDYIISLVGSDGFDILRENNMIESCESINGRSLYTLIAK